MNIEKSMAKARKALLASTSIDDPFIDSLTNEELDALLVSEADSSTLLECGAPFYKRELERLGYIVIPPEPKETP